MHEFSHSYFHGVIFYVNSDGVNICNKPLPLTICISSRLRSHLSGVKSSATITTAPLGGRHFPKHSPKHLQELIKKKYKKVHNLWRNTQRYIKTSVPSLHVAAISYLDVQLIEHLCMLVHAYTSDACLYIFVYACRERAQEHSGECFSLLTALQQVPRGSVRRMRENQCNMSIISELHCSEFIMIMENCWAYHKVKNPLKS